MQQYYDYLIIGGGIAGVTAAETIREHDADARIAIVEDEPHILYSRVLIPSFLKRRIARTKLFLRTKEHFIEKKIDIHHEERAVSIDTIHKDVTLQGGNVFSYGKALLATGGRVKEWGRIEDRDIIYRLQTIDDADCLMAALPAIHNPLVVGSSFISLEFLEIFLEHNITPIVLSREPRFFAHMLDEQGSALLDENFKRRGIRVDYDDTITHIGITPAGREITTKQMRRIPIDAIAVGIGIDRNLDYAKTGGIEVGSHGIKVNEYLETNAPDIFAAGDAAEYYDTIIQDHRTGGNWTNAVLQGKRAGLNMVGMREAFISVPSYSITNLGFQITALGDMSYQEETLVRIDKEQKRYARFFFKGNYMRGAVLINRFGDKAQCAQLIEHRVDLAKYKDKFGDNSFDINTIPVVR